MDLKEKYKIDAAFELLQRDSKYVYADYKNGNWFRTNTSGCELLKKFDGKSTADQVIKDYADKSGFPYSAITTRITSFIDRAIERKLLLKENENHVDISTDFSAYPVDLWIHVTDKCNMHCPFCYSSSGDKGVKKLDKTKIISFVEKIPADERKNIIISGGEPLLYEELPELVKELKTLGFHTTVISNGTVESEKYDAIIPYIDTLQISIDGPVESVYEKTRGKGNFEKAVRTLDHAHEAGVKNMVVSFTSNKFNIDHIQEMPEFARIHHVNHLHITKIIPSGRANDIMDKIVPTAEEFGAAIHRLAEAVKAANKKIEAVREDEEAFLPAEKRTRDLTFTVSSDPVAKVVQQTKITTCSLGCGTLSIGYDGKIYPCGCLQLEKLVIGNIDEDVTEIMKRGHKLGCDHSVDNPAMSECYDCKYKYICGGGCRACANSYGNIKGKDPMCDFYIKRIEGVIWESKFENI